MFELDIKNKITGELNIIFGYSSSDAFKRYKLYPQDWIILNIFYVD